MNVTSEGSETLIWRRQLTSVWLYLLIAVPASMQVLLFIHRLASNRPQTADVVSGILNCTLLAASTGLLAVEILRTRVRLTATELEVRHYTTKLYPYSEITDVQIDRGANDRTIKITLADSRQFSLPAPTRGLRKPSDPTMSDAVAAIRTKAGLPKQTAALP